MTQMAAEYALCFRSLFSCVLLLEYTTFDDILVWCDFLSSGVTLC